MKKGNKGAKAMLMRKAYSVKKVMGAKKPRKK